MEFFGFALNVWGSIALGAFIILMTLGCYRDMHNHPNLKWEVLGVFVLGAALYTYFSDAGYAYVKNLITVEFLKIILIYFAIGIGYSIISFVNEIRKSKNRLSEDWKRFLVISSKSQKPENFNLNNEFISYVNSQYGFYYSKLVHVEVDSKTNSIVPILNKSHLSSYLSVWVLFWPFYAINLIIGDVLANFFTVLASIFSKLSENLINQFFKNTFKNEKSN